MVANQPKDHVSQLSKIPPAEGIVVAAATTSIPPLVETTLGISSRVPCQFMTYVPWIETIQAWQ